MATTRISYTLPPHINPLEAPLAFDRLAVPKLKEEMQSNDLITRQKAVYTLSTLAHCPEKVYQAISTGCVQLLKNLLKDLDDAVRHKAIETLKIMAQHSAGRSVFIRESVIPAIGKLFDDNIKIVRTFAHQAISILCETPFGAQAVVDDNLIPVLVSKLEIEDDQLKLYILDSLHFAYQKSPLSSLDNKALNNFFKLLLHSNEELRYRSCRCIMDLCVPCEGKQLAIEMSGLISKLVSLLTDDCEEVRIFAAGSLMNISIVTDGKFACISENAITFLEKQTKSECSEERLYAFKALTNISEATQGREELQNFAKNIEFDAESKEIENRAKSVAKQVIEWKP